MSAPLRRRASSSVTDAISPLHRISEHFILADFLGNQTVYTQGFANRLLRDPPGLKKMDNAGALCVHALEPILAKWGPLTISYGFISPELSRAIVKYQDPDKPSHHRFDLGAAADICVHRWVSKSEVHLEDLFIPESVRGSPIAMAHWIDQENIPYSRIITYSESPYLCIAVSSDEVGRKQPRKAFYENRFQGVAKEKPEYIQLSSLATRRHAFTMLQEQGLEHPWEGGGFPSYHGGGRRQYQHMRVSKYTMVSDWLMNLQSIAKGEKNIPALNDEKALDALAAAGTVYDKLIDSLLLRRMSIVSGYVNETHAQFHRTANNWRGDLITFGVVPPASFKLQDFQTHVNRNMPEGAEAAVTSDGYVTIQVDVDRVLMSEDWA